MAHTYTIRKHVKIPRLTPDIKLGNVGKLQKQWDEENAEWEEVWNQIKVTPKLKLTRNLYKLVSIKYETRPNKIRHVRLNLEEVRDLEEVGS